MNAFIKTAYILFVLLAASTLLMAQGHNTHMKADSSSHILLPATDFKWMDAPPGLPKGAKVAILSGDPGKEGHFVIRVMFPANYQVKPHWHPTAENITVIKGTLFMGTQENFDMKMATKLDEGSFAVMPAKHVHYAFCKVPTVIQLHGMGPFAITYVKASDDPRNMTKMP